MKDLPYFMVQRTPESMGFKPGTYHMLKHYDRAVEMLIDVLLVEIVEVADNFLLGVRALDGVFDRESGDYYPAGETFTVYRAGDHDHPYLTFVPCMNEDDMDADYEDD